MLLDDDDLVIKNSLEVPITLDYFKEIPGFEYLGLDLEKTENTRSARSYYDFRYTYPNTEQIDFEIFSVDKSYVARIFIPRVGEATSYTVGRLLNILDCIAELRQLIDECNEKTFEQEKIKVLDKYLK